MAVITRIQVGNTVAIHVPVTSEPCPSYPTCLPLYNGSEYFHPRQMWGTGILNHKRGQTPPFINWAWNTKCVVSRVQSVDTKLATMIMGVFLVVYILSFHEKLQNMIKRGANEGQIFVAPMRFLSTIKREIMLETACCCPS